ncbi:MAG: GNAT family N-acetyltransferase [Actinomycetota bacterium]|nr:GNAT family N-acetyltransferase [Actinomycetota bacterium]
MVIDVQPATVERFADVASLLGPRREDAPACWCLTYRLTSSENSALRGQDRPARLKQLCARDVAPGLLAYLDGEPVGWCALGPRTEMGRLQRSRTIPVVDELPVWSVVCFVVRAGFRRRGVAAALLDAAVSYAAECGAEVLEAYPVDPAGARISASLAFVGTTSMFERASFHRVVQTSARSGGLPRWLVRRYLISPPGCW